MGIGDEGPELIDLVDWYDLYNHTDTDDEAVIDGLAYRGRWDAHRASKAARPPRGAPYFPTDDALGRWATDAGPELDRSLAWFFTARRCPLTGDEWEPPRDLAACALDAWADNALAVERQFLAGELAIE